MENTLEKTLSPSLTAFVSALNSHDSDALAACFTENPIVWDEGRTYRGKSASKAWFETVSGKYHARLDVLEVLIQGSETILHGNVSGFDGSPIQLRYRLRIEDGKVAVLRIEV
jgi:ketosteroid isomerase-like protein